MEAGEYKIRELFQAAEGMPHDAERIGIYEQAIDLAKQEKLADLEIEAHRRMIWEQGFYQDMMQTFIMYPVLLGLVDRYVAENGRMPQDIFLVLWTYKSLIGNCDVFHQVTRQQFEQMTEDCIKRYWAAGYNRRSVCAIKMDFYAGIDLELAKENYRDFLRQKRDSMSDCPGCERSEEVSFLLDCGQVEEALAKSEPLFRKYGIYSCECQPGSISCTFIEYIVKRRLLGGEIHKNIEDRRAEYAATVRRYILVKHMMQGKVGIMLIYYSIFEPEKVLGWFKKHYNFAETHHVPRYVMGFAMGMMLFLNRVRSGKKNGKLTYRMKLSPAYTLYREDGEYDIQELYAYYDGLAYDIAKKFEESQGRKEWVEFYQKVKDYKYSEITE